MKVVVDANKLLASLIKDGPTRHQILTTTSMLYAPDFLRLELAKHRGVVLRKSKLASADLAQLEMCVLARVRWVSDADVMAHLAPARKALDTIDPKDVPYLAAALAVGADAIWSDDTDFDAQSLVPRTRVPDRIVR